MFKNQKHTLSDIQQILKSRNTLQLFHPSQTNLNDYDQCKYFSFDYLLEIITTDDSFWSRMPLGYTMRSTPFNDILYQGHWILFKHINHITHFKLCHQGFNNSSMIHYQI